jgi:histone H3/H4
MGYSGLPAEFVPDRNELPMQPFARISRRFGQSSSNMSGVLDQAAGRILQAKVKEALRI